MTRKGTTTSGLSKKRKIERISSVADIINNKLKSEQTSVDPKKLEQFVYSIFSQNITSSVKAKLTKGDFKKEVSKEAIDKEIAERFLKLVRANLKNLK